MRKVILIITPIILVLGVVFGLYYRRSATSAVPQSSATPLPVVYEQRRTVSTPPNVINYRVGFIPIEFPAALVRPEARRSFSAQKKIFSDGSLQIVARFISGGTPQFISSTLQQTLAGEGWTSKNQVIGGSDQFIISADKEVPEESLYVVLKPISGGSVSIMATFSR